jgi:hypothetical protein
VDVSRARAGNSLGANSLAEERGAVHVVDVLLRVMKGTADTEPQPLDSSAPGKPFTNCLRSPSHPASKPISDPYFMRLQMGSSTRA